MVMDNSKRNSQRSLQWLQYFDRKISKKNEYRDKTFKLFWDRIDRIRSRRGRKIQASKTPEQKREYYRNRYFKNRDKKIQWQSEYYRKNKERITQRQSRKTLEQKREYLRKYYATHKDEFRQRYQRQKRLGYYRKNRDRIIQRTLQYYHRNKDKVKQRYHHYDKEKINQRSRERYHKTIEAQHVRNKLYREKNKEILIQKRKLRYTTDRQRNRKLRYKIFHFFEGRQTPKHTGAIQQ